LNFRQINMNHCWQAKNLLDQAVVQEKIDVVIASDPQGIKHDSGGWVTNSGTGGAAIGVFGNAVSVADIFQDVEFVATRLNSNIHVVSCYVSPRPAIAHFQAFLQRLENYICGLQAKAKVLIAGD